MICKNCRFLTKNKNFHTTHFVAFFSTQTVCVKNILDQENCKLKNFYQKI